MLNKFWIGNVESMDIPGARDVLMDFHKQWYSSNLMCLTVSSKHSLADLEKWTTEKFTPVANKNVVVPDLGAPPCFPKKQRRIKARSSRWCRFRTRTS